VNLFHTLYVSWITEYFSENKYCIVYIYRYIICTIFMYSIPMYPYFPFIINFYIFNFIIKGYFLNEKRLLFLERWHKRVWPFSRPTRTNSSITTKPLVLWRIMWPNIYPMTTKICLIWSLTMKKEKLETSFTEDWWPSC